MLVPVILLLDGSAGPWTVPVICMVLGGVLLSAGIFGGGIKIKEIVIPRLNTLSRALAGAVGICFVIYGVYASNSHKKQLRPFACSDAQSLKSSTGGDAASVQFINKTDGLVTVWWKGLDGLKQQPSFSLNADTTATQQTYQGHPWLVEDEQGRCLMVFVPNASDTYAIVQKK